MKPLFLSSHAFKTYVWNFNLTEVTHSFSRRAELVVNRTVVVELKAKTTIHTDDKAPTLSHLRLLKLRLGLLIHFHEGKLVDRVQRMRKTNRAHHFALNL